MGTSNGFEVVASEDPTVMSDTGLAGITAIAFVSKCAHPLTVMIRTLTPGSSEPVNGPQMLDTEQRAALQRFYGRGGGHIGIHAGNACLFSSGFFTKVRPLAAARL